MSIVQFVKKYWYYFIFLAVVSIYITSIYQRVPNEDEAVIAGHSYFLNKLGYVKSDLYGGYLSGEYAWENRQYHYHKFFVITGMISMKLFGFNIYSFKAVSFFYGIIFFIVLFFFLKKYSNQFSKAFYISICSLILFTQWFFDFSFMFRPEIMLMTLGFISFYFLEEGLRKKKKYFFLISGLFAGLSVFTHLNGLIYPFAGLILLLHNKQYKASIYFLAISGLFSLFYLYDIHTYNEFLALLYQFKTDPNVVDKLPFYINLLDEQKRFFHSPKEVVFSLMFIFSLILNFRFLRTNYKNLMFYLLFLILGLGMLAHGKTTKYFLCYLPYISIIIIASYANMFKTKKKSFKIVGIFLLICFVLIHGFYNFKLIGQHIDIAKHNEEISKYISEKQVKISAPSVFVFNEIKNYIIRGEIAWDHHYSTFHPNEPRSLRSYFLFAEKNYDKFIIIDKKLNSRDAILKIFEKELNLNDTLYNYVLIKKTSKYLIFNKKK